MQDKQFVGIDLHRRRTVIVRTTEADEVLETVRIVNDVQRLASVMRRAVNCDIAGALPSHLWRSKCCFFQRPASVRI